MKKYDSYLFFMSLATAILSVAAIPGIPDLVTSIYAAQFFDGKPTFSAGTTSYSAISPLPSGCTPSQIGEVAASGYDLEDLEGYNTTPDKTIDKNFNTRWANYGVGSYVQYELASSEAVCGIDISWYRGDVRTYDFIVSTSQDGNNFDDVFFSKSNGTTTSLERYLISDSAPLAKHVRITVNGNTENQWAGITEVQIHSQSTPPLVTQATECPCPPVTPVTQPPVIPPVLTPVILPPPTECPCPPPTPVTSPPPPPVTLPIIPPVLTPVILPPPTECPCPSATPILPPPATPILPPPATPILPPPATPVNPP